MNSDVPLGFDHRFIAGEGQPGKITLLLLHGTGGDGDSLLQLGYTPSNVAICCQSRLVRPTRFISSSDDRR